MQPHCLFVCRGGKDKERGVWAMECIKPGLWFGPLEGEVLPADGGHGPSHQPYIWEIHCRGRLCNVLGVSNSTHTNWLRHVTSTYVSWSGVNMAAYQYRGKIYYVTTEVIGHGQELILGLNGDKHGVYPNDRQEVKRGPQSRPCNKRCSVCRHRHDKIPIPAQRSDRWRHTRYQDVQIYDFLPILKLSSIEVPERHLTINRDSHTVNIDENHTSNSRRVFSHRIFYCLFCGWRFRTFVRFASHKRNHKLRYLKIRIRPRKRSCGSELVQSSVQQCKNSTSSTVKMHLKENVAQLVVEDGQKRAETVSTHSKKKENTTLALDSQKDVNGLVLSKIEQHIPVIRKQTGKIGTLAATPVTRSKKGAINRRKSQARQLRVNNNRQETPHYRTQSTAHAPTSPGIERSVSKILGSPDAVNDAKGRFGCTLCKKYFMSNASLRKHTRVHTGEKPYVCSYCSKGFAEISNLNKHLRVHTGHTPYKCTICDKKYKYIKGYKIHMRNHERGPITYKCCFCDREFNQKGPCKTHERWVHLRARAFKCSVCQMKFKRQGGLQMHREKVHKLSYRDDDIKRSKKRGESKEGKSDRPIADGNRHRCAECGKGFKYNYALKQHVRTHTGEKPFKCTQCDATFAQSSNLTSHRRIHTGETPYECHHCKKRFNCTQNLRSHLRVHTGEKPYKCPHCPARFAYSSYLTTHNLIHVNKKPHQCTVCGRRFRHNASFKIHCRIHSDK